MALRTPHHDKAATLWPAQALKHWHRCIRWQSRRMQCPFARIPEHEESDADDDTPETRPTVAATIPTPFPPFAIPDQTAVGVREPAFPVPFQKALPVPDAPPTRAPAPPATPSVPAPAVPAPVPYGIPRPWSGPFKTTEAWEAAAPIPAIIETMNAAIGKGQADALTNTIPLEQAAAEEATAQAFEEAPTPQQANWWDSISSKPWLYGFAPLLRALFVLAQQGPQAAQAVQRLIQDPVMRASPRREAMGKLGIRAGKAPPPVPQRGGPARPVKGTVGAGGGRIRAFNMEFKFQFMADRARRKVSQLGPQKAPAQNISGPNQRREGL